MRNRILLTLLTVAFVGAPHYQVFGRESTLAYLKAGAHPLESPADLDPLIARIGEARIVLLGEASHGTAEYYTWRAAITKRLIAEKGFSFVAVEGDWPSCYEVNRFVKQLPGAAGTVEGALAAFQRWPQWMWANRETADLAEWMATHNAGRPADRKAGFFGIDLYAPGDSISAVLAYTQKEAPGLNSQVQAAYGSFAPFDGDFHQYARYTATGRDFALQARSVVELLREHAATLREANPETFFNAKQNAYAVKRAEMHYRAMADPNANSWNERAEHMKQTFTRLLDAHGPTSKGIVWAHNTHIGDARATDMAAAGMKNIGWLARETYGADNVVAVGFATHRGRLLAGRQWGGAMETMTMPPAVQGSAGDLFNQLGMDRLLIIFDDTVPPALRERIGHRAKGVTYHPERDSGNYVPSILPQRYDAMIFIAETTPLTPLGAGRPAPALPTPSAAVSTTAASDDAVASPAPRAPRPPAAAERVEERHRMVETQMASPPEGRAAVRCPRVLDAMRQVPRHAMVPPQLQRQAYGDSPLPIGYGQTISQPYIVAMMTELLDLQTDSRVLEIGTGSGYQAAVLAHMTPHVYSIEIVEPLLTHSRHVLEAQDYGRVQVRHGDGYHGWADHAPFDAIIVTCAAGHLPPPLWDQLKDGGRIVIPIGGVYEVQRLVVITKDEIGSRQSRTVMPVRFVPMTRLDRESE